MLKLELDQSGKIESTNVDTALATSDGRSLLIPASVKRTCLLEIRREGRYKVPSQILVFTVGVFLLVQDRLCEGVAITIDEEYRGNGWFIKDHLLNLFKSAGHDIDPQLIEMGFIGKHSPAHSFALATYRKTLKPQRVVSVQDILTLLKRHKKRMGRQTRR